MSARNLNFHFLLLHATQNLRQGFSCINTGTLTRNSKFFFDVTCFGALFQAAYSVRLQVNPSLLSIIIFSHLLDASLETLLPLFILS